MVLSRLPQPAHDPSAFLDGIQIRMFGPLQVTLPSGESQLPVGKLRDLLAYLLLQPRHPHLREILAEALWPELLPKQGRRALSDTLYRLKRLIGAHYLETGATYVALLPDSAMQVDVWRFIELADSSDPDQPAMAVQLYQDDLLPEIYADWILLQRIRLRERYLGLLEKLADTAEQSQQWDRAREYFQRMVAAEPLREEAYRGLMRCLAHEQRLIDALEVYVRLEQLLEIELGVAPAARTHKLALQLRNELALGRRTTQPANPEQMAFVGRAAERTRLLGHLDQAHAGRGGLVVVLGEAGIGKTRLLRELGDAADWRGGQVVWGRGEDLTLPMPYAPLRQALIAALPRPRSRQLVRLLPQHQLYLLAQLVPELAEAVPDPPGAVQSVDAAQLGAAIALGLRGLCAIAPMLLILDDAQWADPNLWPILESLRAALANMPILVVVSGRIDELRRQADTWPLFAAWDRAGVPILRLSGLDRAELGDLARAYGADTHVTDRLLSASGGNPLFALHLLQTPILQDADLPPSLDTLLVRRTALLSDDARRALQAAALLGFHVDYALWEALLARSGFPLERLPVCAGELEQHQLLVIEQAGYRFAHDALRTSVYAHLPGSIVRRWHRDMLTILEQSGQPEPTIMLFHAERADERPAIGRYALQAGLQMSAAFSYRAACAAFEKALAMLDPGAAAERYAATLGLIRTLEVLGERERQSAAVRLLNNLAEELNDDRRRAEAAWHQAHLEWLTGQFATARATADALCATARRAGDSRQLALLLEISGRAARDMGDYPAANTAFVQARAEYAALNDLQGAAWIDGMLGLVAQRQGQFQAAIEFHMRAMQAYLSSGQTYNEMRAASGLAVTLWMAGDYLQARTIFERTLVLSRDVGDRRIEESSLANLGGLADILGDYDAALELKQAALAISRATENKMGIALGLCNLGISYYKLGQLEESVAAFEEAIRIDRATGRRQGEAYALHGLGVTLLAMGRTAEARRILGQAHTIRAEQAERDGLIAVEADLILAALADDDLPDAFRYYEAMIRRMHADDRADLLMPAYYAAYRVMQRMSNPGDADTYLQRAAEALQRLADVLPPEARTRFTAHDPQARSIQHALADSEIRQTVRLVRDDVPLGRRLRDDDYCSVTWTVETFADQAIHPVHERRRHVLRRLLEQAGAQGAAPTDDDLAQALGVSRRTILRDMAHLATHGLPVTTRRRMSQ